MFQSTDNGFRITFANGWAISVQYGPYNYCSARRAITDDPARIIPDGQCENAEVAVFDPNGKFVRLDGDSDVIGWQTPEQVATLITFVSSTPYFLDIALRSNLETVTWRKQK